MLPAILAVAMLCNSSFALACQVACSAEAGMRGKKHCPLCATAEASRRITTAMPCHQGLSSTQPAVVQDTALDQEQVSSSLQTTAVEGIHLQFQPQNGHSVAPLLRTPPPLLLQTVLRV